MTTRKFEGSGPIEGKPPLSGFEKWKAQQAKKAKTGTAGADQMYERYLDAATGRDAAREAGVVEPQVAGGRDVRGEDLDDDRFYGAFKEELSGESGRRRAEASARAFERDRRAKALADAKMFGYPLRAEDEDLRDQLRNHGY